MSRKYKFYDKEGLYFVSFATVYWIDVFVRDKYCEIFYQQLVLSLFGARMNRGKVGKSFLCLILKFIKGMGLPKMESL